MSGTSTPLHPKTKDRDDASPSSKPGGRSPSVLGLLAVSGLNVISLAFIVYHFANHPDEPAAAPLEQPMGTEISIAPRPLSAPPSRSATRDALGNVDFMPAPKLILNIASRIDMIDLTPADLMRDEEIVSEPPARSATPAPNRIETISDHWVQLGALSNKSTAQRYWSGVKQRHEALLKNLDARYFGPDDVGGSLYHIRLGPMTGDAAAELCTELKTKGADCFCLSDRNEKS